MREWQAGDPIGDGNDIGVPDIKYFDYLKDKSGDDDYYSSDYYDDSSPDYEDDCPRSIHDLTFDEILKIARQYFDMGKYDNALYYYHQALNRRYSEEAECGKAKCFEKLGRDDEASRLFFELGFRYTWGDADKNIAAGYYKRSLECNPNNEDSLDNLGYVLRGLGKYEEALTYYQRIKNKDVDWAMAMCYMEMKKYEKAIPLLDNVIEKCHHCDDHLDQKCECLIGLNRKNEAIELWKKFIDFLMKNECYERAIERIDLLSKNTQNEHDFINEKKSICLKEKESLDIRFMALSNVMSKYHMYNPNGLDENDLYGFVKYLCEESGESVDDIVRWYKTPMLGSSSFSAICDDYLHYIHWDKIVDMYEEGKFKDFSQK